MFYFKFILKGADVLNRHTVTLSYYYAWVGVCLGTKSDTYVGKYIS